MQFNSLLLRMPRDEASSQAVTARIIDTEPDPNDSLCKSGKRAVLRPLPPLRTGHDGFLSSGSSRGKALSHDKAGVHHHIRAPSG